MRLHLKFYSTFLISMLALMACKKDDEGIEEECREISGIDGYTKVSENSQFRNPSCNPNNASEFVYTYHNEEIQLLLTYNMKTGVKTELENRAANIEQLKWGRTNWITFDQASPISKYIYIIKQNGDSLRQITTEGFSRYPVFSNTGHELIWTYRIMILSQGLYQTTTPDTLSSVGGSISSGHYSDISVNNDWLGFSGNSLVFKYGSLNDSLLTLSPIPFDNSGFGSSEIGGLCWDHTGTHFYCTITRTSTRERRGIYRIGLDGSYEKLIGFCDTKKYSTISCSPDGQFLIAERIDSRLDDIGIVYEKSSIWQINLNTLEQERIYL